MRDPPADSRFDQCRRRNRTGVDCWRCSGTMTGGRVRDHRRRPGRRAQGGAGGSADLRRPGRSARLAVGRAAPRPAPRPAAPMVPLTAVSATGAGAASGRVRLDGRRRLMRASAGAVAGVGSGTSASVAGSARSATGCGRRRGVGLGRGRRLGASAGQASARVGDWRAGGPARRRLRARLARLHVGLRQLKRGAESRGGDRRHGLGGTPPAGLRVLLDDG